MSSSTWIGSLNIDQFISTQKLREITGLQKSSSAQVSQLTQTLSGVNTQLSVYSQLNGYLSAFQSSLTQLQSAFTPTYSVASSNSSAISAQVANNATIAVGTHTVSVSALAQASSIASQAYASNSSPLNITNTLTLQVGTNASFQVNVSPTDTLQSVANNINSTAKTNNQSISASVISTGVGQYQLVISSTQTGVANALTLSETGTGGDALHISTGGGGTGAVLTTAQDAAFKFDNLDFTNASNSNISIMGMNISLSGLINVGTPASLTVSQSDSTANVTTAVQNVVSSYNQALSFIEQAQAVIAALPASIDSTAATPPDSTLSSIQTALQNSMGAGTSAYQLLNSIGVEVQHSSSKTTALQNGQQVTYKLTGLLEVNTDATKDLPTLSSSLTSNFAGVQSILTDSVNGIATTTAKLISQPGAVWKALYDGQTGSIPKDNLLVSSLQNQIDTINKKESDLEAQVSKKYADLSVSLSQLQNTSIFVAQTVAMWTKA